MLYDLLKQKSGNFAIMFALLLVPLVGAVGLAVDYTTASAKRSEMQHATDGAVLAIARAGNNTELFQAKQIARRFIDANYSGDFDSLDVRKSGETWTVSMSGDTKAQFAGVLHFASSGISAVSSATFALTTHEIGLVLDTTGSMEGEKMRKLKEAARTLVDTMVAEAANPEALKFALVPFSTFVNVGPQFGPRYDEDGKVIDPGAEWLDLRGKSPIPQVELARNVSRFDLFRQLGDEWEGCVETRDPYKDFAYDVTDLAAEQDKKRSLFVPALSIDEPDPTRWVRYPNSYLDDEGTDLGDAKQKRMKLKYHVEIAAGASGDDDDDDDDDDEEDGGLLGGVIGGVGGLVGGLSDAIFGTPPAVDTSASTFYSNLREPKGPNFDCVSEPIVPLTNDVEAIKNQIDSLVAKGSTNLLEGMMWGWRVLSPSEPFAQGRPKSDANNEKIIVFLTDGANSVTQLPWTELKSAYSSFGYRVDERLVDVQVSSGKLHDVLDEKTLGACTNAKADGIRIFTIRLELSDSDTGGLLKECASSEGDYFDVPDASQLQEAFDEIRAKIRKVRITS